LRTAARAAALLSVTTFAPEQVLALGPPIRLADPPFTTFTGRSLVVTDLDGASGPDLAGVEAANVVFKLRQGDGSFPTQQSLAMGATLSALGSANLDAAARCRTSRVPASTLVPSASRSRRGASSRASTWLA